jgi:hypothetical protein
LRDKNRIPEILKKLEEVWKKNPDLRLGQLISNVWPQPFFPEDDAFIKAIEAFYGGKEMPIFRNFTNPKVKEEKK